VVVPASVIAWVFHCSVMPVALAVSVGSPLLVRESTAPEIQ
jgi:hypothetical protein